MIKYLVACICITIITSCAKREASAQETNDIKAVVTKNILAYDRLSEKGIKETSALSDRAIQERIGKYALGNNGSYASSLESLTVLKIDDKSALTRTTVYKKATTRMDNDQRETAIVKLINRDGKWLVESREVTDLSDIVE